MTARILKTDKEIARQFQRFFNFRTIKKFYTSMIQNSNLRETF